MLGSKHSKGMTLIELMITIAILAVVAAIATPSLSNFINSNRLTGVANNLNATLISARSEAVKLKTDVTVAPVSGSWSNGWTVSYVDGGATVELLNQGKNNLHAPWLGITGFITIGITLTLLVFIGEAFRDAFDPRKINL